MNKEQQELLDEAYENYEKEIIRQRQIQKEEVDRLRSQGKRLKVALIKLLSKEEFIKNCKTDTEFSKQWGLKIEERDLSLEERMDFINKMSLRSYSGWQNWSVEEMEDRMNNDWNIPTRLITITYNDTKIESYEQH